MKKPVAVSLTTDEKSNTEGIFALTKRHRHEMTIGIYFHLSENIVSEISFTVTNGIGWIRLLRAEARNAFTQEMRVLFAEGMLEFARDEAVRVVVLTGSGKAFCAGTDLKESGGVDPPHWLNARPVPLVSPLEDFPKPVIAAINGIAVGGGLELALASDLRIASRDARFGLPEVKIGSLAGSGGTQRLFAAVGSAVAAKMILTGALIDAEEALRVGLISDLADPEALDALAEELASKVAANAPLSLLAAKRCILARREAPLKEGLALERTLWALLATTNDRAEGRMAFRERRAPNYVGK
ncbi:MAG: enoyl-CoA hydratase/isomerase family protein [Pseudaminobacter sp.]